VLSGEAEKVTVWMAIVFVPRFVALTGTVAVKVSFAATRSVALEVTVNAAAAL